MIKLMPGVSNRQIEIPLALATINSERFAKIKNELSEAKRTTKGSISNIIPGSFKVASLSAKKILLSFDFEILLDNSIVSIKKMKLDEIRVQYKSEFKRFLEK
tara:strand:- start:158 stop:466 length:309 start_codon:yes stop_codon:yes gene_type:complete